MTQTPSMLLLRTDSLFTPPHVCGFHGVDALIDVYWWFGRAHLCPGHVGHGFMSILATLVLFWLRASIFGNTVLFIDLWVMICTLYSLC